ncbi:MAG TPA: hypothetical protein VFQ80_17520, partial [Thermomicrobiales bacterium]|nr:hypothetical protein [Thermomicrobiales bacterium]
MLERALYAVAKKPEAREQARTALAQLLAEHPRDVSVQIAAALQSLTEDKPDRANEAIERLSKLVTSLPLEKLPEGKRANARQRTEAARQIGLWLVARECLRRPPLRTKGEQLGRRAVEAARRQLEPHFALAMLREWGQIELDRGDRKAAEQRWAEMLDVVLPPPTAPKRAQTPKSSTPTKPAPAASGENGSQSRAPKYQGGSVRVYEEVLAAPPPPAAPVPPGRAQAPAETLVLAVTTKQFDRAAEVAKLAAEQKMFALSLRAVRDALRGGPPVTVNANTGRNSRTVMVVGGGGMAMTDNANTNQHDQAVANQLSDLVARWRREGVAESDIYDTLADVVLPAARPAEVFLYTPAGDSDPSRPGHSVGRLLAESALRAKRLDDLRRRIAARQDQPLGELNARILLAQTALVAKDDARLNELLKEFAQRLQKDTLRHTAALICQAAAPALEKPETAAAALPVIERAAKNLVAAGGADAAANVLLFLARHDLKHGRTKEGRARLKEVMDSIEHNLKSKAAQSPLGGGGTKQNVAWEYIRAGLLGDALDLFATVADLPEEQRTQMMRGSLYNLSAAFARQFGTRAAAERYDLLKKWTLPTPQRRSVRVLAAFVPTETPPAAFGKFTVPPDGVFSTPALLIDAAREVGKLDELAAEVR